MFNKRKETKNFSEDFPADMARTIARPVILRAIEEQKAEFNRLIMKECVKGRVKVEIITDEFPFDNTLMYLRKMKYHFECRKEFRGNGYITEVYWG